MTNTALLEAKIAESGLKKNYIAKTIGLSPYGLARKIRNESEFKSGEIDGLCEVLQISSLEEKDLIFFAK